MGSKKRRRSESFQAEQTGDDDARKRLAAFHERMFDLPQEKAAEVASEMPRVVFKSKHKKRKHRSGDVDDDEPMPVIKFNKTKVKKEKKKKKKISAAPVKLVATVKVAGQAVKVPGKQLEIKNKPKKVKVVKNVEVKIEKKKDKKTFQAPQWHSMTKEDEASDDVDLLEQALGSMKEIAAKQTVQPLHKKPIKAVAVKKEEKLEQKEESAEKKHNEVEINDGGTVQHLSKHQKKKQKKMMKALKAQEKNSGKNAHENTKVNPCEDKIEKVDVIPKEKKTTKLLTPIAASLAKDAKKKNDMFLSVSETSLKPEVSTDLHEGLGVNLSAKQLIRVFEAGSGNSEVLVNKMASAVENGHLSVHDADFVSALERRVALMESNGEVMQFLHPLLESLSTVRDVGCLLKKLCEHWQLERKMSLVQQVLLSNVFDDLDDFPSRLDQEDVDENGNLKGFLVNDDSEYSGEEGSEEDDEDEIDSEADENPYEGESDSDEEVEITGRSRGRNQFIEDEVEVGDEDEEEEEEQPHSDAESSSSDSD
eukprot:jgi/Phyca11/534702/estExt2_fgenesh1_pg.C_PHYCAscaffold_270031